jgi:hypothetical protein
MEIQTALIDKSLESEPIEECLMVAQSMERLIQRLLKEEGALD